MSDNKGSNKDRKKNKDEQGTSRNLSNRMYGYEEGDEKPAAAEGSAAENIPTQEGAIEKNTHKSGISYEPDKNVSGTQGAFGQGNDSRGADGPQGYGATDKDQYKDTNYDGIHKENEEDKKEEE
jgi:hypothetical protein